MKLLEHITYGYQTDVGRVRSHNEDHVAVFKNNHTLIMLVADGVGGHEAGDVASKMAHDVFLKVFNDETTFNAPSEVSSWANDLLTQIDDQIVAYAKQKGMSKIGTTLVVAIMTQDFISFVNVGDSRAYIFTRGMLRQVTKDHTFVRRLVDEGQLTERAAKLHPQKNVVINALGTTEGFSFDFSTLERPCLDGLLLCSDGLTGMLEDEDILAVLSETKETDQKIHALVNLANEKGGRDNISVVFSEWPERRGDS